MLFRNRKIQNLYRIYLKQLEIDVDGWPKQDKAHPQVVL